MHTSSVELIAEASALLIEYRQMLQPGLYRFEGNCEDGTIPVIREKRVELPETEEGETYGVLFDFCDDGYELPEFTDSASFATSIRKPTLRKVSEPFVKALIPHLTRKLSD